MSASVQRKLQQAHENLAAARPAKAAALCEEVLERAPRNPDALWLLGTARLMEGHAELAVPLLERAVAIVPDRGSALESLGLAYLMAGDYAAAERVLRKALAIPGAPPSVRMRLGAALLQQGQHGAAIETLERALAMNPGDVDARLTLGRAYASAGRWNDAAREFDAVLARAPDHLDALFNLGLASMERGEAERAASCFERILARDAAYVDARERFAAVHVSAGRYGEAIPHLREVLRVRSGDAALHVALANACFQIGELDDACAAAGAAIEADRQAHGAYHVLALTYYVRGELDRAIATLETGYARIAAPALLGLLVHLLHRVADWEKWQRLWPQLERELETASDIASPFWLLPEATTPQQQLSYTRRWAAARFRNIRPAPEAQTKAGWGERRLRVGYFSSDFQEHAVGYLIAEALELHDRERFEIYAYSYGPDDSGPMRARLSSAVEHFVDVAWQTDQSIVKRIRDDALDVLVDLKGYTVGDRLTVMAHRPCAVQVTWLGYPGTTGADFIDYVIADGYIIPAGAEHYYSERVLRMPVCYQPNDRKRVVAPLMTRSEYALPESGFIFCCFTQAVKIMPDVFARWMSLLTRVPASVLWLLEDNALAMENLRRAAAAAGVDPERLVMAGKLPNARHLARFAVADLALDTFPYTSHTTASDALWGGCPLVVLCGETFAARVSGSIVTSAGLADLVTHTLDEYEALAYRLATDPAYMESVKVRLAEARNNAPSFDALRFARDLEQIYREITR